MPGVSEPHSVRIVRDRQGNRVHAKLSNFRVIEARRALLDEADAEVETKAKGNVDGKADEG